MNDCGEATNGTQPTRTASPRLNFAMDEVDSCQLAAPAIVVYDSVANESADCVETVASDELHEQHDRLKGELLDVRTQLANHQTALQQKDNLLELQRKELALLESEKDSLRREYETAKREKEHAVVRYAMLEKNIIDAKNAKDLSARKLKEAQRENELLSTRIKAVTGERDKSFKEVRDCIRENESLKYDLQACETKFKWNQVKLKQQMNEKAEIEKKFAEISLQCQQITDQRQQQIDCDRKVEREQGAQLIMLKHSVDEKDRLLSIAQKQLAELRAEFTDLSEKREKLSTELDAEKQKKTDLTEQLARADESIRQQEKIIEDNRLELKHEEERRMQQQMKIDDLMVTISEFKGIDQNYREQAEEMAILRSKEDDQLRLLRDLTEKCVAVENKLILANSKASALSLDNERLAKDNKAKTKSTQQLSDELDKLKLKHSEEIKLFNRIVSDEKDRCETLQSQLDNVTGDLEATRNKHTQIVKEMNREVVMLRLRRENGSAGRQSDIEDEASGVKCQQSNGHQLETSEGPTKKALIDRIVKLQRQLAKQTEKIEFLENHCVALFNELKAKPN